MGTKEEAQAFLAGRRLRFDEADALWRQLMRDGDWTLARGVLERLRAGDSLIEPLPAERRVREMLCQQHALLTSKDETEPPVSRHDRALAILAEEFDLDDPALEDPEALGIAGGIHERRWKDLGQLEDLRLTTRYYQRGTREELGQDAYVHINAAYLEDYLAQTGDAPERRRHAADELRRRIVAELPIQPDNWWNAVTRAEAHIGLGNYAEATEAIRIEVRPEPWQLETTARQLARLAHFRADGSPGDSPELRDFFSFLLGGSEEAVRSTFIGKVGLSLSGGGFRAAYFHLGVLARLAELDLLRHVEVLSGVSGGSVVAACYWLALRRQMLESGSGGRVDYPLLVKDLISHFHTAVAVNLRRRIEPSRLRVILGFLMGQRGAMKTRKLAQLLDQHFFRPLLPGEGPLFMDQLAFVPVDFDPEKSGGNFDPARHNWLRMDKVPELLLTATAANNGQMWVSTAHWLGELEPRFAESTARAERLGAATYKSDVRFPLALAVAASCCVPVAFQPVDVRVGRRGIPLMGPRGPVPDGHVLLADGGVYDNTGARASLARNCDVLLVSDASGTVSLLQQAKAGILPFSRQAVDTMLERVRQGVRAELRLFEKLGLIRGLMYVDIKKDLDPSLLESGRPEKTGVRQEYQKALAELRTDLDAFTPDEAGALMACGYQMARTEYETLLSEIPELQAEPVEAEWPFGEYLQEIAAASTETAPSHLLGALRAGRPS